MSGYCTLFADDIKTFEGYRSVEAGPADPSPLRSHKTGAHAALSTVLRTVLAALPLWATTAEVARAREMSHCAIAAIIDRSDYSGTLTCPVCVGTEHHWGFCNW